MGLEQIWGAYEVPLIGNDPPRTAAWGFCDRDYPREQIVSPYPFRTAKAHYAALLADARRRGGPTRSHAGLDLPDWSGQYMRDKTKTATWYYGAVLQIPTYLSLLTPEYQKRFVQQMYHYSGDNSPQWPGQYCWPEGFMRRFAQYGGNRINLVITPDLDPRHAQFRQDAGHADPHGQPIQRNRFRAATRAQTSRNGSGNPSASGMARR